MSAVPLRVPDAVRPSSRPSSLPSALPGARTLLRLVPQRRSKAARTPFAVVLVVLLVGGLLGLLLLNTLVAQDSFTLHDLSAQSRALQLREQQLASQVEAAQAPEQLAQRATKLGMVPGGPPAFLRLPDGHVLGRPTQGKAAPAIVAASPAPAAAGSASSAAGTAGARGTAPTGSTTWTAPRQTPPPNSTGTAHATGAHR